MFKLQKKEKSFDEEKEFYIGDEFINPMEIVEAMENSDFPIKEVYLKEEADVGFYYFQGSYSVEEAKELYPKVKGDVEYVAVRLKYGCQILIKEKTVTVTYPSHITLNISKYLKTV